MGVNEVFIIILISTDVKINLSYKYPGYKDQFVTFISSVFNALGLETSIQFNIQGYLKLKSFDVLKGCMTLNV